jgi:hypothetical protein
VEIPETLPYCLKPAREVEDEIARIGRALVGSLTPEQRRRLQEGERLHPPDLSGAQHRLLTDAIRCAVAVDPSWKPEALAGSGVWLRASSEGARVELMLPNLDLDCSISLFEL